MDSNAFEVVLGILEATAGTWLVLAVISTAGHLIDGIAASLVQIARGSGLSQEGRRNRIEVRTTADRDRAGLRRTVRFETPEAAPQGRACT